MSRSRLIIPALLCLGACSESETVASLEVNSEHSTYLVTVRRDAAVGYPIEFECIEKCARPITYREEPGEYPMGLLSRNYPDELVFYQSSAGSALVVRAWQVTDDGVRPVLETWSRGFPDFLSDGDGRPMIQTHEADSGVEPTQLVRWTFRDGAFVRDKPSRD